MTSKLSIISLGGSLIVPEQIDIDFLKKFKRLIELEIKNGHRFIIICGGGKTARNYQNAASKIVKLKNEDIDWLGIHSTRINAHLLRTIFHEHAHPRIVTHPLEKISFNEKIMIAAGWKPGFSTDYDAVILSRKLKADKIINLSNIDYAYDKDPRKYPDAMPIENISWPEFRKLLPEKWSPGLNSPFDPIASKAAEKLKIEVAIINGKNLKNLKNCIEDKKFIGTKIK